MTELVTSGSVGGMASDGCLYPESPGQWTRNSLRMDLAMNTDGSVDIYIGSDKPEGSKAKNWIPTEPGRAWFPYFRLYSPKQAFLDRTWVLPDIEKAN